MIESMCVVCHSPVPLRSSSATGRTGITCSSNCRSTWRRIQGGCELPDVYLFIRWQNAYRRELELGFHHIASLAQILERAGVMDERTPLQQRVDAPRRRA